MTCLLAPLAWLWLQGGGLEVRLYTDEDRITLGDDLVLTVQATATGTLPVQISLPNIAGFEITGPSTGRVRTSFIRLTEVLVMSDGPDAWPV